MPSSEDSEKSSLDDISTLSRAAHKRKLHDRQSSSSASPRPPAVSEKQTHLQSYPKRQKTSHSLAHSERSASIGSTMALDSQPRSGNHTRASNFQPSTGAKKLVIKNLRTTSRQNIDEFYNQTWTQLDDALTSIFAKEDPKQPLEIICRGVESICRKGRAHDLFMHLKDRTKAYIEKQLLPQMEKESGSSNVEALVTVHKFWTVWNDQSTLLRSVFSYLDRSYLLNMRDLPQLEDLGILLFRQAILAKSKIKLGERVVAGMCDLVAFSRTGQGGLFDAALLKDSVLMLHIFGSYTKSFEPKFLQRSDTYFTTFAQERSVTNMKDYISACDRLLNQEALRCDTFNFDSTTKRKLLDSAHLRLIKNCSEVFLDANSLGRLIDSDEDEMVSLKALYRLLSLSNIEKKLRQPFETHVKSVGATIVADREKADDMVVRLLQLKRTLDVIIRDAFEQDDDFTYSLRETFGKFINDSKITSVWGTGNSKVGEMIAKYMDMLLRGGLKAVPRALLSDAKDRDTAERQGQASTGDEDAELDRQLEQALELFRFIEGKDVFEAFYKKDLARRLLMGRSASQDAERNMLAKLKTECGYTFTHNLETMFKDQDIARDEMSAYKQYLSFSASDKPVVDLQVSVLSAAAWPSYPDVTVKLPAEVGRQIESYDVHYKAKHTGRRLLWKHSLGHSVVKARFKKGMKELLVSGFQAIVLVLFNDVEDGEPLSYESIMTATGLPEDELERTLQSLACAKFRVLTKYPKGRDINPTDTFTVNLAFTDPKTRIKINQIQLKETKEENKETHERVHQDRQYETQAAIVRIMKARKRLKHVDLVTEVIDQTKKRGAVEIGEIKKNIEKLIEKEYIERLENGLYEYMA